MSEKVVSRKNPPMKMGIIGHGFVGKAIDYAFSGDAPLEKMVVDPKYYENTIDDLISFDPNIVFVCLPTPSKDDGSIDSTMVEETVKTLIAESQSFIVIKSTITPDVAVKLCMLDTRIVYSPEFLSEGNAKQDIVNSSFLLVGVTEPGAAQYLEQIYNFYSICNATPTITVSPVEASLIKYGINTFLATKVTFMNELYNLVSSYGGSFQQVLRGMLADMRIGYSHTKIPGTDGKKGFGGACFPKDLSALINFAESEGNTELELLKSVRSVNNKIRSQYETDDREKANNIKFDNE